MEGVTVLLADAASSAVPASGVVVAAVSCMITLVETLAFGIVLKAMAVAAAADVVTLAEVPTGPTGAVGAIVVRPTPVDVKMPSPPSGASVAAELIGSLLDAAGIARLLLVIEGIAVGSGDAVPTPVVENGDTRSGATWVAVGFPFAGDVLAISTAAVAATVAAASPLSVIGSDEGVR